MEVIKLSTNAAERNFYDSQSDLYSILLTTESLERAYVKDAVNANDYTQACSKLIAQFKTLRETLIIDGKSFDISAFVTKYRLNCPGAIKRLCTIGVPATVEHGSSSKVDSTMNAAIAQVVAGFITTMDGLKLNLTAVDELHPHLADLAAALSKTSLPSDHVSKIKVMNWLTKLNSMRASDEVKDEDARQMSFDLEQAFLAFQRFLEQ